MGFFKDLRQNTFANKILTAKDHGVATGTAVDNMVDFGAATNANDVQGQSLNQKMVNDMTRMVKEKHDQIAWNEMMKPSPVGLDPTIKEQDFDCLRDFLVDMCSATLPESPPTQKEWDQIRARAKEAAVEHAMHNRDEKKAVKKPGGSGSTGRVKVAMPPRHGKSQYASQLLPAGMMTTLPKNSSAISGHKADLMIIDDVGLDPDTEYSFDQLTS